MLVVHIVHVCLCSAKCAPEAELSATNFWMALKTGTKTTVFCMPLFCRYQDFVEQHEDPEPEAEHGHIKVHCGQRISGWR